MPHIQADGSQYFVQRSPEVLGRYSVLATTGTMAAGIAAAAPIFSFRWGNDDGKIALVHRVQVSLASLATGFTAGIGKIAIVAARAFSASDTGGAAVTLTTNNGKRRTNGMGTSLVTDMRIATTAALGAGTRTLDAQDMGCRLFAVSTGTNFVHLPTVDVLAPAFDGDYPQVLEHDEGVIVRVTLPATGTWQACVQVDWSEVVRF